MSSPVKIILSTPHPNARNVESFLNSWTEPFETLDAENHIFRSTISHTEVKILFFNSQDEGFTYGQHHFGKPTDHQRWGMNGGFLYAITGNNPDLISNLAGHFAGRE